MRTVALFGVVALLSSSMARSQNYDSYRLGSPVSLQTAALGGICLMGGASENDSASVWFLKRANSGDVLVLRATGTDGYNNYFFNQLGQSLNSVETLILNDSSAAYEPYVLQRISEAEALFFAGGNQWTYVREWRDTPLDSAIRYQTQQRNAALGGTSAGMAILGGFYNTAENGSLTSSEALADPFHPNSTLDSSLFVAPTALRNILTDTHFDNPDRRGRLISWMARLWQDRNSTQVQIPIYAIACEEFTAVCIEPGGWAKVYGEAPAFDDKAWFVSIDCENLPVAGPERCVAGQSLDWVRGQSAVLACAVPGSPNGANGFDLNDWRSTQGGTWQHWWVSNGILNTATAAAPDCSFSEPELPKNAVFKVTTSNEREGIRWSLESLSGLRGMVQLFSLSGQQLGEVDLQQGQINARLSAQCYVLRVEMEGVVSAHKVCLD